VQYQVEKYIHDHGVNYQTSVRNSENLADDTLEFADEVNADLIIIMSEQEKTFKGLFMGSYAQQLLSIATRPVLTIPPKVHMVMAGVSV
jgi:nucleotide-binding universal stress UspA family protein